MMEMSRQRADPILSVINLLKEAGFHTSDIHGSRSACFDVVARKNDMLLLVKVLPNIDSVQEESAFQLKLLGYVLSASVVLVGERTRKGKIEDDALYERYGVPAVSYNTLKEALLRNIFPVVYAKRGGFYVHLNGDKIKREREKGSYSLGDLAEALGVSRRAIYEYERNEMDSTLGIALRLEEFFKTTITIPFDLLSWNVGRELPPDSGLPRQLDDELEENVSRVLSDLGLRVVWSRGTPFDAITYTQHRNNVVVTGVGYASERKVQSRIEAIGSFSSLVRSLAMFVLDRPRSSIVRGVPVVSTDELESMDDASELLEAINVRKRAITK